MDDLLWLDRIQASNRLQVGEKAFYLSQLRQKGYPVIGGFVIPSPVLRQFLETIEWLDPLFADLPSSSLYVDVDNPYQLQQVAQRIRREMMAAALPETWESTLLAASKKLQAQGLILRPTLALPSHLAFGSTGKISGLLESHVCACTREAIAFGVKRVWAELFRARSLLYWQRSGIKLQQIHLGILVQPIHDALASGRVLATKEVWEIQATWGLGMALVRGEVFPDYYQVQPDSGAIARQHLGSKTIAYRLSEGQDVSELPGTFESPSSYAPKVSKQQSIPDNYLQTYLLSEEQQKKYALEAKYLTELIELTHRLRADLSPTLILEWTLALLEPGLEAQLYLTQAYPRPPDGARSPTTSQEDFLTRGGGDAGNVSTQLDPSSSSPLTSGQTATIRGLGASSGRAMGKALLLAGKIDHPEQLPPGRILLAPSITPDWLPLLQRAAGVVAEQGGMTSHIAIIARELGIPAVVGVRGATKMIKTGDFVMVDGDRGEIYRLESGEGHRQEFYPNSVPQTLQSFTPLATRLLVNLSQSGAIEKAKALPVDGVGLLRSEVMMLELLQGQHPSLWVEQGRSQQLVERLTEHISRFASAFAPRPVFYRSLDLRAHEFQSLEGSPSFPATSNPMLGVRGTFSYLVYPEIFQLELTAIAAVYRAGYTNVRLILPFVRTVEEFSFCRRQVEQAGLTQYAQFELWIMAEVPSVLLLLPDYVKAGVQGISIGTNDLTQLLLGVDRDQSQMAAAFDSRHPAVMRAVQQLIQTAKQQGIPTSICGQAPAQYPDLIEHLVRWGIESISVSLDAVDSTYSAIARAEHRIILEASRRQLDL
ncbi:putative PEP-binding protein [Microseira wollei]|uniref:Phosphoenolpyruvate synthase n=1 Tax=Microseira wollei NIES-4236 TaxID=2530354 RepID=A0AAV3XBS5_9CYAN|nr:putative PEP-binding protein [Microseira wollei]GET38856.1 PEP-utilizing enzyme [Microseira wollei NIES-4236]